jgi:histidine ammonia-lyase
MTVVLDGASLTLGELVAIAQRNEPVELAEPARARMERARVIVEDALSRDQPVYGLTTGLAERKRFSLAPGQQRTFNRLLVQSHRVAQGPTVAPQVVRAMMACLVNGYAKGLAGVRPALADVVIGALNEGFSPVVRSLGSLGQADLGPMAELAEGLLDHSGFSISENEGLALVNSNALATASAVFAFLGAECLLDTADVAAALDLEAFAANLDASHDLVVGSRPYPGIARTVANLRRVLQASSLWEPGAARNLQDPLTFRCVPQIHGACRDALAYARGIIETELNAAQGNPAVVEAERRLISVGNSEILHVAAAMDFVRIALAPVLTSAAERTVKLLQAPTSGLTAGLAAAAGTAEDALAEFAVASQSLVVEARALAGPVSYELASTSKAEGIEDRTTMAPFSARRLAEMVDLGARVIAVELLVAAQAADLRPLPRPGRGARDAYERVRHLVPFTAPGEAPPEDLEPLVEAVRSGEIALVLGGAG